LKFNTDIGERVPGEYIVALLSGRRFAPSWFATFLALAGIASTISLGLWQLRRADEKQLILTQIEAGAASLQPLASADEPLPRYQTVTAEGRYDTAHQVLLDNMPSLQGRPGYRVLTPFELANGGWILIDRGWIPMGPTREARPSVAVGGDMRTILGRVDELPRPGLRLAGDAADASDWPRVMNFPEHADLERALDRPLAKAIVRLDPSQSDGFERSVAMRADFGPNRHIAYAVQWFAFAATMLVIYVLLNLKPRPAHDRTDA
jgi:surfeit locus 1 family protein